ncbi:MAG TPA: hypothetical protein DDW62_03700, partial [Marinilabiliaceae bacterium]|nr:hypothetical protein [Marinilabiliaceae bacterium]
MGNGIVSFIFIISTKINKHFFNLMKVPQFIKPGALVGLVSPAGKIAPEYLDLSRKYLDKIGMRHISGTNVINSWHQFAGTDEQRAADLQAMINNPEVSVIW